VTQDRGRPVRQLPDLTGPQFVDLQDALLFNADRLLTAALTVLRDDNNIVLSRSLASSVASCAIGRTPTGGWRV